VRGLLAMRPDLPALLFDDAARRRLDDLADLDPDVVSGAWPSAERLHRVEVLVTGWQSPYLDADTLAAMPALRAVLHTGGSVRHLLAPEVWDRGVLVTSAATQNARPVAEYTLAVVLLAAKGALEMGQLYRSRRGFVDLVSEFPDSGVARRRIGVVGASTIGRRVVQLLSAFDVDVDVHDPYLDAEGARLLGVQRVSLHELAARCDVVTLHAPELPETHHLVDAEFLALMREGATLVNTARGGLVDHEALERHLVSGRLRAVLDVTEPEVLPADSPLHDLPNVLLTPHVAGATGRELARLGNCAVQELDRLVHGHPPLHPVTVQVLRLMA
jgi:phosphoglycerate dehydrogenase-like enzyme